MTIQTDLDTARQVFVARLDEATRTFAKNDRPENIAGATDYMSTQLVLLTDLSAALLIAVTAVADRLDALEG